MNKKLINLFRIGLFLCFLELFCHIGSICFLYTQDYKAKQSINASKNYKILCLGESITYSTVKESYPKQLQELLNQNSNRIRFEVINGGRPGSTTQGIDQLLKNNIKKYNPDMIIIMAGVNDAIAPYEKRHPILLIVENTKTFRLAKQLYSMRLRKKEEFKSEEENIKREPPRLVSKKESLKFQEYLKSPGTYTIRNYNNIHQTTIEAGKKLIIMQYPMIDIDPLKNIFSFKTGITFVENKLNFNKLVMASDKNKYFVDLFAVDFGHCTALGNKIIAQGLSEVIMTQLTKTSRH